MDMPGIPASTQLPALSFLWRGPAIMSTRTSSPADSDPAEVPCPALVESACPELVEGPVEESMRQTSVCVTSKYRQIDQGSLSSRNASPSRLSAIFRIVRAPGTAGAAGAAGAFCAD